MLTKDSAICIRAVDYSETSQILTFFTRATGKISAIAKGSKRPKSAFDGPVEVFSYGKIVFIQKTGKKLAILTEFEQQPALTNLSNNLFALNCSLFADELVNNLTDDYDPHPELFDNFLQFLKDTQATSHSAVLGTPAVRHPVDYGGRLTAETRDTLSLLILFQLALLKEIGLQPILNACANCKNNFNADWPQTYFSSSANGLICRDCEASFPDRIRITKTAANCLSNLKLLTETNEKTLNEIEKILIYYFTELLRKPPKMAKYILKT